MLQQGMPRFYSCLDEQQKERKGVNMKERVDKAKATDRGGEE
jgi:hypothetical protein